MPTESNPPILSPEALQEIGERCAKASPLPLEVQLGRAYAHEDAPPVTRVFANGLAIVEFSDNKQIENAELFVTSRTDIPALLVTVEHWRKQAQWNEHTRLKFEEMLNRKLGYIGEVEQRAHAAETKLADAERRLQELTAQERTPCR